jgi:hypothetical protein
MLALARFAYQTTYWVSGLQDTNLARVRATQMYLMKCDHVFVVAQISRAITDQSLKSSLYNILARHVPCEWEESGGKRLKVSVVCTKSEVIRPYFSNLTLDINVY